MPGDLIFLLQLLYYVDRFPVNYYNGFGQELLPVIFVYAAYVFYAAYVSSMENIQMHKGIFKRFLAGSAALLLTAVSVLAGPSPLLRSTAYAGQSAVVQASALNVRSGPGTSYSRVDELVNGSQVIIEEEVQGDDGKVWAKISFSGRSGYVQKAYLGTTVSYSGSSDSNFEAQLSEQGFPESYRVWLRVVHAQYPNWIFRADHVGVDWEEVIRNESVIGRNLVEKSSASSWKSTESGAFDWASNYWPGFDGSNWVAASEAVIRYYMDPRNFLNTSYIFQFQTHSYNASTQTAEGVEKITEGTFMAGRASNYGSASGPTPDGSAGPAPDGGVSPTPDSGVAAPAGDSGVTAPTGDSGAAVPAGNSGAGQTSGSAGQTPAGGTVGIAPGSSGSQTTAETTQTASETTQAASPDTALTEQAGISPDVMTISKGLTGGYLPMSVTCVNDEIYDAFYADYGEGKAFPHSHTYAGNPIGCAAALAVQKIMKEQHILETAAENAKWLTAELDKAFAHHPNVGEIRHIGLIHAIELVKDPATKEPLDAKKRTGYAIYKKALERGLVLRPLGDILYFNPPLNITREELSTAIELAHESITDILPE